MSTPSFIIKIIFDLHTLADAILGVSLFADIAPDQFGKFNRAFVTLFRIAAGDTWIDTLPTLGADGDLEWKPALYVCSFIVLSVWIVLQVSVAVLLDNFVTVSMRMENEEKRKASKERKAASQFQNPLEPLIKKLANEYTDNDSLSEKLVSLFQVMSNLRADRADFFCVCNELNLVFTQYVIV